jgi:hypothetical protein
MPTSTLLIISETAAPLFSTYIGMTGNAFVLNSTHTNTTRITTLTTNAAITLPSDHGC